MIRPEHYRSYSAVFPILLRDGKDGREVLLHLRQNTGYMDGTWDLPAAAMWMKTKRPVRPWLVNAGRSWEYA